MIQITIYQDSESRFTGFDSIGHAEYAEEGSDIVCAGVSALVIATVNSIEMLTEDRATSTASQETGEIHFRLET